VDAHVIEGEGLDAKCKVQVTGTRLAERNKIDGGLRESTEWKSTVERIKGIM